MAKKEKKPYDGKINTVSDAKDILNESIKNWEKDGATSKIIALGRYAEKWTGSGNRGDKEKMKILYTSINGTTAQIKRDKALGISTSSEETKLQSYKTSLSELEAKYGKYIPIKPKNKTKPVIE